MTVALFMSIFFLLSSATTLSSELLREYDLDVSSFEASSSSANSLLETFLYYCIGVEFSSWSLLDALKARKGRSAKHLLELDALVAD